jgi:hypothetical protein
MKDFNAFVSPEYPVLHTVLRREDVEATIPHGHAAVSLALLVKGIPSFLATIPVDEADVEDLTSSLGAGKVRVAVVGVSVDGADLPDGTVEEPPPWAPPAPDESRSLPAAYLSLVCADGRRIGVARIVARQESASPEDVARFVLKQIARGVQIPDLASTS